MSSTQKWLKRGGLLTALLALMLTLAVPAASGAGPEEATEWLSSQLKTGERGEYWNRSPGRTVGQTIDCMLAFDAAGAAFEEQRKATYEYVKANLAVYVGSKPCSEATSLSAGSVAKLALGVAAQGDDPMNVGGRNLIADLLCLQPKSGEEKGRFKDKGALDFSNVFGQSLGLMALKACAEGSCQPARADHGAEQRRQLPARPAVHRKRLRRRRRRLPLRDGPQSGHLREQNAVPLGNSNSTKTRSTSTRPASRSRRSPSLGSRLPNRRRSTAANGCTKNESKKARRNGSPGEDSAPSPNQR